MKTPAPELNRVLWGTQARTLVIQQPRGLWTIAHQGRIVTGYTETVLNRKYLRTVFAGPAHAARLAARLNHVTGGTDYTVVELTPQPKDT